ncbi:MAG: hypothetical protein NTY07_00115 [Bacteroidia bacterium]|nr:hypothetical protein [Bacteroidia bacterium]
MSKRPNFFWASYADLMTSLFFIMLVLFVLTVVMLKRQQAGLVKTLEEYKKIEEIKKSINEINKEYFEYRPEYKKHILKLKVQYTRGKYDITNITDSLLLQGIVNAGREIQNTIQKFTKDDNIKYLVIIEGQASKDGFYFNQYFNNDVLSYQRALGLKKFWEEHGISLDKLENCELIVAGSGEGGIPRELPDIGNEKNQRFLIHIIPKTGEIGVK